MEIERIYSTKDYNIGSPYAGTGERGNKRIIRKGKVPAEGF
jgi:hypothetical protein